MTVNLSDIIDALNFTDEYTHNFLDKTTEEIVWVSDMAMTMKEQEDTYDTLDEHGFYRFPEQRDIHEYRIMEDFRQHRTIRLRHLLENLCSDS